MLGGDQFLPGLVQLQGEFRGNAHQDFGLASLLGEYGYVFFEFLLSKHINHGGNVQVITVPDGWPIWTSDVRPGREHDTTAVRTHTEILPILTRLQAEDASGT